jgi:hypothetical protein
MNRVEILAEIDKLGFDDLSWLDTQVSKLFMEKLNKRQRKVMSAIGRLL